MRTLVIFETFDSLIIAHDNQEDLDNAIKRICLANDWQACYTKQIPINDRKIPKSTKKYQNNKVCPQCGVPFYAKQERKAYCDSCVSKHRYEKIKSKMVSQ